ncbi:phosphoethanolamine transferase [Janthinobacterium sp. PAMC25594]|uniref:phosphoethanolamine transferase n=1 Tax=Janthinobacterium sp. PAMC25594 TaxID=2861284 RepID=UPI001C627892|nr:phosphoethanolamine transferase [Janthinobacterium sp. PAMC25594]QYG07681.1 phosphoethanolamine transferase [Janthinobacterium sp. PAMC25594]
MLILFCRVLLSIAGLLLFFLFDQLSANECLKLCVLLAAFLLGVGGVLHAWRGSSSASALTVLLRIVVPVFYLDAAIKGFLRGYFGMRPNPNAVLQAMFATDQAETAEFFLHNSAALAQSAGWFVLVTTAVLLADRYLQRWQAARASSVPGLAQKCFAVSMAVFLVLLHVNNTMRRENPALFWPLRYQQYSAQLAAMQSMQQALTTAMAAPRDWHVRYAGEDARTVILVIGESTNRASMSLYGYPRATTPRLDAMRAKLLVFNDVISPASSTVESMMTMLTPADIGNPDAWMSKPNLLMLAEAAGYKTFWVSNQTRNDGWIGLLAGQADESDFINYGTGRGENNFDGNLFQPFAHALADTAPKKLIVVHLLGAHPSYDMRYPSRFAHFDQARDAVSAQMVSQGRSRWIRNQRDEYDNAIRYGDYVLGTLIGMADKAKAGRAASLLFVSDHGQEVGYNRNHAGHSASDKSGYEIPMLIWNNQQAPQSGAARAALESRPYQTDKLDATVLGLLKIETRYYAAHDDILSGAFQPVQRFMNGLQYQRGTPALVR